MQREWICRSRFCPLSRLYRRDEWWLKLAQGVVCRHAVAESQKR
ncbi:Uncharacterised protein [Vibrio cholerae]|nr:Uncharacterised protein [Vibrio cholerae]